MNCRLCGATFVNSTQETHFYAKEKMFGTNEEFHYIKCMSCQSLQIDQVPEDLFRHYPANYYSLGAALVRKKTPLQISLNKTKFSLLSKLPIPARSRLGKNLGMKEFFNWFGAAGVRFNDSILDFGCGAGHLLAELYEFGFHNLHGVDPFLDPKSKSPVELDIQAKPLEQVLEKFDLVMSHHSFEHVPDPRKCFKELVDRVKPGGALLLRVPFLGEAWNTYGIDWVAFDAPRHLYHFSKEILERFAVENGVSLETYFHDSFEIQFWGSEQYQKGISLFDSRSYGVSPEKSIFSESQMKLFKMKSQALNRISRGDQACYIFRKP